MVIAKILPSVCIIVKTCSIIPRLRTAMSRFCWNEVEKRGPYGLADFFIIPAAGQLGDIDGDSCGKADNDIRKNITMLVETPIATTAFSPIKLPAIMESAILYNCCSRAAGYQRGDKLE